MQCTARQLDMMNSTWSVQEASAPTFGVVRASSVVRPERSAAMVPPAREQDEQQSIAYNVSHDLRSPLRTIDAFCQMVLEDYGERLGDDGRDYLERAITAGRRLGELIDDMLDMARDSGGTLTREEVDLSETARQVADELQLESAERRVQVVVEDGLVVRGVPTLLRNVLRNLLSNAFKYSGRESEARIRVGRTTVDGTSVFYVRDNGVGFEMSESSSLFEMFGRLGTGEGFEGSGVGLASAARIIRYHHGEIWADARPGEGATFFFTLG